MPASRRARRRGRTWASGRRRRERLPRQTPLRLQMRHPVRAQTSAFPGSRTKREHFLDRLRRSWHSHLQWEKWRRRSGPAPSLPFRKICSPRARPLGVITLASSGACMSALDLFLPLAKVDLDRRLVTGVATAEAPDGSGEIFDYSSSKPYFEKWSAEAAAASGGKSLGAVRAMHTPIAAGKLTDIAFDDNAKRITVVAKIVDDDEWRKVQEGVYTGFSQGGRYVKRWADPDSGLTRYTADPHEISLVDLPCVPDATFDVVKDGMVEKRSFASRPPEANDSADADVDAGDEDLDADKGEFSAAQREKDAEDGVAMPDGSYPIRSTKDVANALRDCCRSGEKADVKAHIIARAKAIGADNALPDDWTEPADKAAGANHTP